MGSFASHVGAAGCGVLHVMTLPTANGASGDNGIADR